MEAQKKPGLSNAGVWGMNVVSSVGIIVVNKFLMSSTGFDFRFATTLTGFHFLVTGLVGWAAGRRSTKTVPIWELIWFSIVANLSIAGMNTSLLLNSVGFYQISKLSMIPVVCIMEWLLHSKKYSPKVISAVFVVAFGVGICTVTDVKVNARGFLTACVAVFCTALQQIAVSENGPLFQLELRLVETIGSFQTKYNVGSFELLSKTAPIQAASLIVLGPYIDYYLNGRSISDYEFSTGAIILILLSCALAVFCNMSQYMCIGRFSATSFQVLGHMKTVCILTLGWVVFDSALTFKNIMGMLVAVLGMIIYSWAVESDKRSMQSLPVVEEDAKLLSNIEAGQAQTRS